VIAAMHRALRSAAVVASNPPARATLLQDEHNVVLASARLTIEPASKP
jgi:hypothetical protein